MNIEFYPANQYVYDFIPPPKPAKLYIPEWYKSAPPVQEKNITYGDHGIEGINIKSCMPFIDSLTFGYIQESWMDINISENDGTVTYGQPLEPDLVGLRANNSIKSYENFYPLEFIWKTYWRAKVPKGYSILITHPLNRIDLPFVTMSGVIDSDHFYHTPIGSIPFYVYNSFSGTIPAGTPIFQIIPFKRDNWNLVKESFDFLSTEKRKREIRKHISGGYKNNFRQKKNYN
jgi:hypothetical protein